MEPITQNPTEPVQNQMPEANPIHSTPIVASMDHPHHPDVAPQNQNSEVVEPPMASKIPKIKFPKVSKKLLIVLMAVLLVILVLLLLFSAFGKRVRNTILPVASPTPTPVVFVPELFNPSPYADDGEIKSLSDKLSAFDKELGSVTLREDTIRPPVVNWDVSFKK